MPNRKLMLLTGAGGVMIGLPYIFGFFGPTEQEVRWWGLFCLIVSLGLIILLSLRVMFTGRIMIRLLALGFALLAVLQLLPIQLWFVFHGYAISDGTPLAPFVAHWAYALPHMVILALSLTVLYQLCHRLLTQ